MANLASFQVTVDEKDAPGKFGQMIPDPNAHLPRLRSWERFLVSLRLVASPLNMGARKASDSGRQDYTLDAPVVPMVRQFVANSLLKYVEVKLLKLFKFCRKRNLGSVLSKSV